MAVRATTPTVRKRQQAVIVGVDEAGRGPLAGPVAAGACVLPEYYRRFPSFIADSKALTPALRERAFRWIEQHCLFGCGMVEAGEIDAIGILAATEKAMQMAVGALAHAVTPALLLVDGRDHFWFDYPHVSIVRGDASEKCIAAASIVDKVLRDRLLCEYAKTFPLYGFASHKGYGTPEHIAAIQRYGPCLLHRRSFLRSIIPSPSAVTRSGGPQARQPKHSMP